MISRARRFIGIAAIVLAFTLALGATPAIAQSVLKPMAPAARKGIINRTTPQTAAPKATGLPKVTYTITPLATVNGYLTPNTVQSVTAGNGVSFGATPVQGYALGSWTVDGINAGSSTTLVLSDGTVVIASGTSLTFNNVQGNHNVTASFVSQYTITPQPSLDGAISPGTPQQVNAGLGVAFTATANPGYWLTSWKVDTTLVSTSQTTALSDGTVVAASGTTLTFTNVQGSHNVTANYGVTGFCIITPLPTANGTIAPNTPQEVQLGGSIAFSGAASYGAALTYWMVDGNTYTLPATPPTTTLPDGTIITISDNGLTFSNVQGSHSVWAYFQAPGAYLITLDPGNNGTIHNSDPTNPLGPVPVVSGGSATINAGPASSYALKNWTVDGLSVGLTGDWHLFDGTVVSVSGTTLKLTNVLGNHDVGGVFLPLCTITPIQSQGGTITPTDPVTVMQGGTATFTAQTAAGYALGSWKVGTVFVPTGASTLADGTKVLATSTNITLSNIQASYNLVANYTALPFFAISPLPTQNGTISPTTVQHVQEGTSTTFSASANAQFTPGYWSIDNISVGLSGQSTLGDGTTITPSATSLTISNVQGDHSVSMAFLPTPTLTSITPNAAQTGSSDTTITLVGTGFLSGAVAAWNTAPLTTTFVSSTQLTAVIPAIDLTTAGTFSVTVVNPGTGSPTSNALTFTVGNNVPTLTSITPNSADVNSSDTVIRLVGTQFVAGSVANWNGTALTTTYVSATQLTATIPASDLNTVGTFGITVTNPAPGGGTTSAVTFTVYNASPVITSLSPNSAIVGMSSATVTVTGTYFVQGSQALLNGSALSTTFVSATQLTATVPGSDLTTQGVFSFTVANPGPGTPTSNAVSFTVANPYHVLWDHVADNQTAIWNVIAPGQYTWQSYGPFGDWTAIADTTTPDGRLHVLWDHTTDHQMSIWTINPDNSISYQLYGPFGDWRPMDVTSTANGLFQVAWVDSSGSLAIWDMQDVTHYSWVSFNAIPGWTPKHIAGGPDQRLHVLWTSDAGAMALWDMTTTLPNLTFAPSSYAVYGPVPGWTPDALAVGPDNHVYTTWNYQDGTLALWNIATPGADPVYQYYSAPGWQAQAIGVTFDNHIHVSWINTNDNSLDLWDLTDIFTTVDQYNYGAIPEWSVTEGVDH